MKALDINLVRAKRNHVLQNVFLSLFCFKQPAMPTLWASDFFYCHRYTIN